MICKTVARQFLSSVALRTTLQFVRMSSDTAIESKSDFMQQVADRLFDSAAVGNVDEVKALLSAGSVAVNAKNSRGWTALMFAARNGQLPVIQLLIEKGCDVKILNASGQTALDIASFWNHTESAAFLRQHDVQSPYNEANNYFSQNPLYRASDLRKKSDWLELVMKKDNTKFIVFSNENKPYVLNVDGTKKLKFASLNYAIIANLLSQKLHVVFLGLETWDPHSSAWFAIKLPEGQEEICKSVHPDGHFAELFPTREILNFEGTEAGIFAEAHSVLSWLDRYQFCPTCGSSTQIKEGGYKRVCDNADCRSHKGVHNTCYPRVDPSLIMLVVSPDGKRCLLGRAKRFPGKMYSCLAGFMEPGECIEDTCRREVEEESGIKVGRVEYHSSQPWPFPATLMLGCIAHARTEDIKIDPDEMEDVRWFPRSEVTVMMAGQHPDGFFLPPAQAIARQLITSWVKHAANL